MASHPQKHARRLRCATAAASMPSPQLNVKLNTLKTHLKSIYTKTSADNRAALTKLMLSLSNG
jgi:hypothetical protein